MILLVCETSVWRDERVAGKWAREWVSEKVSERVRSLLGDKQGSALGKMRPLASRSTFPQNRKFSLFTQKKCHCKCTEAEKNRWQLSLREIGCFDCAAQHLIKDHCRCCIELTIYPNPNYLYHHEGIWADLLDLCHVVSFAACSCPDMSAKFVATYLDPSQGKHKPPKGPLLPI